MVTPPPVSYTHLDVYKRQVWIILENSNLRIDACAVKEGVVDDCWGALLVSGRGLSCINWGNGDLGLALVDIEWLSLIHI